jgi:hypothetical protein
MARCPACRRDQARRPGRTPPSQETGRRPGRPVARRRGHRLIAESVTPTARIAGLGAGAQPPNPAPERQATPPFPGTTSQHIQRENSDERRKTFDPTCDGARQRPRPGIPAAARHAGCLDRHRHSRAGRRHCRRPRRPPRSAERVIGRQRQKLAHLRTDAAYCSPNGRHKDSAIGGPYSALAYRGYLR